jgi:GntR family transcriptional regulator, transcriptional repressor for pyruvate dehydrogenase complex
VIAGRGSVPAYQVLADALRARILTGELKPGEKLPIEPELSTQYGVSRSTVREALRVLASQNLVMTTRGVSGGSFVAYPNPEQIAGYLEAGLRLLNQADNLTIGQIAEARDMLEVPAAALAAQRRSDAQLQALRATLYDQDQASLPEAIAASKSFHGALVKATGSPLVEMLSRPVFEVVYDHVQDWPAPEGFWGRVAGDHEAIFDAVEAQDPVAARSAISEHLRKMRPACA